MCTSLFFFDLHVISLRLFGAFPLTFSLCFVSFSCVLTFVLGFPTEFVVTTVIFLFAVPLSSERLALLPEPGGPLLSPGFCFPERRLPRGLMSDG